METLIDTSPVGVVVFDGRTGKLVSFNREARRIVEDLSMPGRSLEELLGMVKFRRADGREVNLAKFPLAQQLVNAETVRAEEIVISVPDGRSVTALVNATPIQQADGAVESIVVTVQDLAPLKELERARAEFLSLVSHELRVPLTSIKGSTAAVLEASPAPHPVEMLQFFRIVEEQVDHMRGLISDLLDAGHIEAGMLSVTPEPTELGDLVDQARKAFLSGGTRHSLRIDLPTDLPRVLADRQRIVQVLNNLFSNASKYSPAMFPIGVSAVQDGVHVAVSVSDKGRGIPPEQLPHLFRKYARVGEGKGVRGSGLGLAICKGLVEAHGGRIRAESGGERPAQEGSEKNRILVVDDDPLTLRFVRDALSAVGYTPLVAGSPQEVPHLIRTKRPQLVLMDLVFPDTDGIELMQSLPELADLPVIFISAYGRDDTIAKALEMGAADYIVKPFSPRELTARVQSVLRKRYATPKPFQLGDLVINYGDREVTLGGKAVELTPIEYDLLRTLSVNAGRVTTYDSLIRQVWSGREYANSRLVRTFVKNLRRKLGHDPSGSAYINNVRGVGYRMPQSSDDL